MYNQQIKIGTKTNGPDRHVFEKMCVSAIDYNSIKWFMHGFCNLAGALLQRPGDGLRITVYKQITIYTFFIIVRVFRV